MRVRFSIDCSTNIAAVSEIIRSGAACCFEKHAWKLDPKMKKFLILFENKMMNIHPSLIPSFCGDGFYGEKVHQAVIDYGAKVSGATVHFVNEEADAGPIIMQDTVKVMDDDDAKTLAKRVLEVEHTILPRCVKLFCEGKISVEGRKVKVSE